MSEASVNKLSQDKEQYQDRVESDSLTSMEDALAELGDIEANIDVQADQKANEDKFDTGSGEDEEDVTSDEGDLAGEETFLEMRALKIKARFLKDGAPNYFEFAVFHPRTVADLDKPIKTENDFYLGAIKPFAPIGKSIKSLAARYAHYGLKSAYDTKSNEYTEFTHKFRPHHAHTEGGKGLAMYSRPVLYTKAGMSSIVNINIAMGCPSFCSFCKEALIGREYTEFNALEATGYVKLEIEGEVREYPAKTSVKFYDPEVGHIVYGPIQVPIAYGYPIAADSLSKLRSGLLGRLSAD